MSIIIVGGGMTGVTLALALHTLTGGCLPITLIEKYLPQHQSHPGFDARTIALAQGSCHQLQRLSLWPLFAPYATPIRSIHVSDQGHAGCVTLTAEAYQLAFLGQVVALQPVGNQLFQRLMALPNIRLYCPNEVVTVERSQEKVSVHLDSGETLQGALLIAADGTHSSIARACHFRWQRDDYDQVAVIANIETEKPHQGRAFERFTPQGPLALLPMLPDKRFPDSDSFDHWSTLAWCHSLARQEEIATWSDAQFCHNLQREFGWRLGSIIRTGQRRFYPLALQVAEQHISHRVALVGNAAQTLHPIAAQGFNLALRDAVTLAEVLEQAWRQGEDPGSYSVLRRYQKRRQPDQQATVSMTDSLLHLFTSHHQPLVMGRNIGLTAMNCAPFLRNRLIDRTLGWVER